jgi:oligoendopeptidase F
MNFKNILTKKNRANDSGNPSIAGGVSKLPSRNEVDEKYKWNLKDIYDSDEAWEKEFVYVLNNIANYKKFQNTLADSAQDLLSCLKFDDELGMRLERLSLYASLAKDSDMRVTKYQAMDDRTKALYANVSTAAAFIRPELLNIPDEKLMNMVDELEELKVYKHSIDDLLRTKAHTLTKEEEEIISLSSEISMVPYNTYSIFTNADIKFPSVEDEVGKEIDMSHARFYAAMYSGDRNYRERAFKSYLSPYMEFSNTFTTMFNGNLKTNIFNSKARKYNSTRESSLDKNNIPLTVYDNLVETANKNLKPLHRWGELKKKLLGVDELHPYDVYVTLFSVDNEKKYSYEEACDIVLHALEPMGENYLDSLRKAFNNRWIDVYETQAKKSGAYSSGTTFGVHPYVLLNWSNLLNDVFTLVHEMGHNMHSYFTGMTQPFPYANYSIFLAEVASTFNESLLLNHFITRADSNKEKLFFLEKYLNNITATFYRQIMFAEFEMIVYEITEKGEALTPDVLCSLYSGIYQKYWGPAMIVDKEESYTWSRIPHFYYNFYVYQYATGFAASEVLSKKIITEGKTAVEKYLNFLKAGSSDYPINILKSAGVDMNSSEPVIATTERMTVLLNEVEALV